MKNLYSSKKVYFLMIFFLLLLGGFSISAQQIITEHNSASLDGSMEYERGFNENNYTKTLDPKGNSVFVKNQSSIQNRIQNENAVNDVNLTLNFVFDDSQFFVSSVLIYNESGYMHVTTNNDFTNPLVVAVPEGNYDIMTVFDPYNDSDKSHIIIKEQQSVPGITTLQINLSSAVNYVSITTYDENGAILQPEGGTGGYLSVVRLFYFSPAQLVTATSGNAIFDPFEADQDPEWNFYINTVTDRYSIIQSLVSHNYEQGNYFTKFETLIGINQSVSIANNPANWVFHTELFQPSQTHSFFLSKGLFIASTYNGVLLTGWGVSTGGILDPDEAAFKGFINNPLDGDPADLLIIPALLDRFVQFSPTTGGEDFFIKGNAIFSDGNGGVVYGSGDVSFEYDHTISRPFLADSYYLTDNDVYKLLPSHPRFMFDDTTTPSVIQGNNVPIITTGFQFISNAVNTFEIAYKGRYGESRESDFLVTQLEVKQNESVVYSGTLEDYPNSSFPSNGNINLKLTNNNTQVDGLQGINTTTITYDADLADAPPTLQHLQFRNSDGQVTSILDSNDGATVRLAAGDFVFTQNGDERGHYAYLEGNNVTLSYSVYNQNNWTNLAVTKYPEFFQMPAFGDYYEASLSGIVNQSNNGWYDLKVICIDASGNIQEQVISPAFKINSTLSVGDIRESSFVVYPNPFSNQLNIILPESVNGSYTFKVTDLIGRTVYIKNQSEKSFSWNSSFMSSGVYMLSIENDGKAITKKVIKM